MSTNLSIVTQREVLGRQLKVYGSLDEMLFLASDVAEWIEHSKTSIMLETVDEDEKLKETIFTSGQNREVWMLTEDGLYEVLMQSRKPIAKEFKREVKKVLKELRRTGRYDVRKEENGQGIPEVGKESVIIQMPEGMGKVTIRQNRRGGIVVEIPVGVGGKGCGEWDGGKGKEKVRSISDINRDLAAEFLTAHYSFSMDSKKFVFINSTYKHYLEWCRLNEHEALSKVAFGLTVKQCFPAVGKGYKMKTPFRGGNAYLGISPIPTGEEAETTPGEDCQDSVREFLTTHYRYAPNDQDGIQTQKLYGQYQEWCRLNQKQVVSNAQFGRILARVYPYVIKSQHWISKTKRAHFYFGLIPVELPKTEIIELSKEVQHG